MKWILIICIALGLYSCDTRKDIYKERNIAPAGIVRLLNGHSKFSGKIVANNITDTLKKDSTYKFEIELSDESKELSFTFSGAGELYVNGNLYSSEMKLASGKNQFTWKPSSMTTENFNLKFVDVYSKTLDYNFTIFNFDNWVPVLEWTLVSINTISPLEKRIIIDAHDQDHIYGGKILYYQIIIEHDTNNYPINEFNYVFPHVGTYNISVRARDNSNQWSPMYTENGFLVN